MREGNQSVIKIFWDTKGRAPRCVSATMGADPAKSAGGFGGSNKGYEFATAPSAGPVACGTSCLLPLTTVATRVEWHTLLLPSMYIP